MKFFSVWWTLTNVLDVISPKTKPLILYNDSTIYSFSLSRRNSLSSALLVSLVFFCSRLLVSFPLSQCSASIARTPGGTASFIVHFLLAFIKVHHARVFRPLSLPGVLIILASLPLLLAATRTPLCEIISFRLLGISTQWEFARVFIGLHKWCGFNWTILSANRISFWIYGNDYFFSGVMTVERKNGVLELLNNYSCYCSLQPLFLSGVCG